MSSLLTRLTQNLRDHVVNGGGDTVAVLGQVQIQSALDADRAVERHRVRVVANEPVGLVEYRHQLVENSADADAGDGGRETGGGVLGDVPEGLLDQLGFVRERAIAPSVPMWVPTGR